MVIKIDYKKKDNLVLDILFCCNFGWVLNLNFYLIGFILSVIKYYFLLVYGIGILLCIFMYWFSDVM